MAHPSDVARLPLEGRRVAFAVIHEDPPRVLVAQDALVLERVLALEVVSTVRPSTLCGGVEDIREHLLDERWGQAIQAWLDATGTVMDFYPDEYLWTDSTLTAERASLDVRVAPVFNDDA